MVGYSNLGREHEEQPVMAPFIMLGRGNEIGLMNHPDGTKTLAIRTSPAATGSFQSIPLGPATVTRIDGLIACLIELKKHCHR